MWESFSFENGGTCLVFCPHMANYFYHNKTNKNKSSIGQGLSVWVSHCVGFCFWCRERAHRWSCPANSTMKNEKSLVQAGWFGFISWYDHMQVAGRKALISRVPSVLIDLVQREHIGVTKDCSCCLIIRIHHEGDSLKVYTFGGGRLLTVSFRLYIQTFLEENTFPGPKFSNNALIPLESRARSLLKWSM